MDIASLRGRIAGRIIDDPGDMASYMVDWLGVRTGTALAVVQPDTTADVATVVRWCADHRIAVVPQGGNTGLSGGSVPTEDGDTIVLSLLRLNRIRAIDPVDYTLVAEAGVTLSAVQAAARQADRLFPLSLASEGSCTIGGNLATNAGGTTALRYGTARQLCLGIEAVTADGEIWNGLRALHKDNSGYDLRDLLIGSEGTLAVITAAVLRLFPTADTRATAFVSLCDADGALVLLDLVRERLEPSLTSFELISSQAVDYVLQHLPGARLPVAPADWYVLVETRSSGGNDRIILEDVLMQALGHDIVLDASIAESEAHANAFWHLREAIAAALVKAGTLHKFDVSLPVSRVPEYLAAVEPVAAQIAPDLRFAPFGHLGDGNIHSDFIAPPETSVDATRLATAVHDLVVSLGGSISAEHGLGSLLHREAAIYRSPIETALMRSVKMALDPAGRMNPGKVLPK